MSYANAIASSIPGIALTISEIKLAFCYLFLISIPDYEMAPNCYLIVSGSILGSTSMANKFFIPFIYVGWLVNF